jgi:ATP/maltotriose-dependent transcriptional regulator MalT
MSDGADLEEAQPALAATWACCEGRLLDGYRLANVALQDTRANRSHRFEDSFDQLQARLVLSEVYFEHNQLGKAEDQLLRALELASSGEGTASMYVSLSTVKTHTKAIYRKIGATSRADAVEIGRANGLL